MKPLYLSHFTATSCLGHGLAPTRRALSENHSGLLPCTFNGVDLTTRIGLVAAVDQEILPDDLILYDCRNNRLAQLGLRQDGFKEGVEQARRRYGADRVGLFLGTSTSGILQAEEAYQRRDPETGALPGDFYYRTTQNTYSVVDFVRQTLGLTGPAMAVSTACSSGAKVFGSAARMIAQGIIDAAVVGGVDSLCLTTLYGFNSLELLAPQSCKPFDVARNGISIGEAAAFILLERLPDSIDADGILLSGFGESSDAHHMSSPHPQGLGARIAMAMAIDNAELSPAQIDYINLHGTATPSNDDAEGTAVADLFVTDSSTSPPCSSTKGLSGHTLGAAGSLEAVICSLALGDQLLPGGGSDIRLDPAIKLDYVTHPRRQPLRHVLSNSFGFGGTNCSLILSRAG